MMLHIKTKENMSFNISEFAQFLLDKHKAYSAEPFVDWREIGVLMRLGSKAARLLNLQEDPDVVCIGGEMFEDTFKDIIGYCVLGYYMDRLN